MELTTLQVAAALDLSEQAIRNHVLAGRLPARRHGMRGLYKYREEDLRAFATKYRYLINEEELPRSVKQN